MKKFIVLLMIWMGTAGAETMMVGKFSAGDLSGWETESFSGDTEYTLVEKDGRRVLRAVSQGTASGLYREIGVDLNRTPYLNWTWQVANVLEGIDERSKSGDDYPARVYVVVSGKLFFWRTRAVNYVWSSNQPAGSVWPNVYTGNAQMMAVESGSEKVGQWVTEKRNVQTDFRRLFGDEVDHIDAVAIMTDTDNSEQAATAWYGDIYFSAE